MTRYLHGYGTRSTPQSEAIPGSTQVENRAGGFAWQVDEWTRLERFLILGTEGGTYYVGERKLTKENADAIRHCLKADGLRTVRTIVDVSKNGRAPKNTPAIFALAACASEGDDETRKAALEALPDVCRIGTHLFQFAGLVQEFRGWGRGLRRAIGAWYQREPDALAYQLVKYRQREGWTHRDLLRLAHPMPPTEAHDAMFRWVTKDERGEFAHRTIEAFLRAQAAATPKETASLVEEYGTVLPREALNPEHLSSLEVWAALLDAGMPMTALIRNLATMTRVGLLKPMSEAARTVVGQLGDGERIRKARVHPIAVLAALVTYASGQGARGRGAWAPVAQVVDALDAAFYTAFGNVEPTNARTMLALDVSGSMGWGEIAGVPGLMPRVGSAAMALITAATEANYMTFGFSHQFIPLTITPRQRLEDVVRSVSDIPLGGTDCALPMLYAMQTGLDVDAFYVYTDNETWAGSVHPAQALRQYRDKAGIDAKLVVVGMTADRFSIADPNDAGMLDVVGFDTAAPAVMADFCRVRV